MCEREQRAYIVKIKRKTTRTGGRVDGKHGQAIHGQGENDMFYTEAIQHMNLQLFAEGEEAATGETAANEPAEETTTETTAEDETEEQPQQISRDEHERIVALHAQKAADAARNKSGHEIKALKEQIAAMEKDSEEQKQAQAELIMREREIAVEEKEAQIQAKSNILDAVRFMKESDLDNNDPASLEFAAFLASGASTVDEVENNVKLFKAHYERLRAREIQNEYVNVGKYGPGKGNGEGEAAPGGAKVPYSNKINLDGFAIKPR